MKTLVNTQGKTPKQVALKIAYSSIGARFRHYDKLDMRKSFDKAVKFELSKIKISESERIEIMRKRNMRRKENAVPPFESILQNKLVRDYFAHKKDVLRVQPSVINFRNGRNHWAKNEKDMRVCSILSK
jgi:hypothetical protein